MILLSQMIWDMLLEEFRWPRSAVERVAYLDGVACDDLKITTTVTLPNAEMRRQHFTVSGDAMSEAGRHFRPFGMQRLAQVHTHPGIYVNHSDYDDENAYSQMDGALSIVMPHHARKRPTLIECGVHIREIKGWRRLDTKEVEQVIRLIPGCLDFRRYE
jgi:hypothetical protein